MTIGGMRFDLSADATPSRRWMRFAHPWVAVFLAGCTTGPIPTSIDAVAEGYVRVTLQLAQHDPSLVEGWRGETTWRPGPRVPVAPLLRRIESLQHDLGASSDPATADRHAYLAAQLAALEWYAQRLLGRSGGFDEEAMRTFGRVPTVPADDHTRAILAAVARELPGSAPLASRYADFKRRYAVNPAKAEALMRAALDACRTATRHSYELPPDESVELVFAPGPEWDGYAQYLGSHRTRISINEHAALDVSRALRLACHEGYPGHHLQFLLIDDALVHRRRWPEFELAPAFGRHLLITEGAAEAAADLALPFAARVAIYRDILLPLAGLPSQAAVTIARVDDLVAALQPSAVAILRDYLDDRLTQAAAAERLRVDALTPDPDALLAFAERRRARVSAYVLGREVVMSAIGTGGPAAIARLFTERPFAVQ